MARDPHWVGTWTAAPATADGVAFSNQTLRMHPRISLGGRILRVRLSNAHGDGPITVGTAHVALRAEGAAIVPASDRVLRFGGEASVTIAAGSLVLSDPVELVVPSLADLSVSVYLPGDVPASLPVTGRYARQTNYVSPPGDFSATTAMPVGRIADEWYFLSGIDVVADPGAGGIVTLGDSLTDANISTPDAFCRWPDQLARRLAARAGGRPFGVMNQGLGGNRILHDLRGDSGLRRFDRDVLAQPGVTHAIVMLGTNDLRNRWGRPEQEVNAPAMIAGLRQMVIRAHTRGIKIFGGTLTPFENETFLVGAWTPAREAVRQAVNAWIRESGAFDAVIDFDQGLRDPVHPTSMLPIYDCGDHLHPSDLGYNRMGDLIDLVLFE
jgi:lysophospholipase L1-like esterase